LNTLTIAAAAGFAAIAEPITLILLGQKWAAVTPFLAIFALVGAFKVAVTPFSGLFLLHGYSKLHARNLWIEVAAFILGAIALAPSHGVMGLAYARLLSAAVYFFINLNAATFYTGIRYGQIWSALWRPLTSALIMVTTLWATPELIGNIYIDTALKIVMSIVVYAASLLLTWKLCGQPDGIECLILNRIKIRESI
jgi:O-antigen/teichoic acid export membrane protein